MNPIGSRTPLAALDIRFPRPRKRFVLTRTLATDDLFTTGRFRTRKRGGSIIR